MTVGSRHGTARVRLGVVPDRKSTRLNSSHITISYAVFCLKKKILRRREEAVVGLREDERHLGIGHALDGFVGDLARYLRISATCGDSRLLKASAGGDPELRVVGSPSSVGCVIDCSAS